MKKLLLATTLTGVLLLGACGNEEAEKKDDSKKSESVEKEKETPKKSESKKDTDKKETEEAKATQESVEQPVTQEEPTQQQVKPTEQEKAEANAKVAKENGYTGIPNGDAMFDTPVGQHELSEEELAKEEAKPEYQDVVETEEEVAEAEKEALREKYNGGLSSGEIQTKHAIEQGYYDGDDADEVMAEIEKSEQEIADGKYDQYKE